MNDNQFEYGINRATSAIIALCGRIIIVILALALLLFGVNYGFRFGRSLFYVEPAEEAPGRDVEITVTEYETYDSLAEKLYEAGAISNQMSFVVQGTLYQTHLFPGAYTVNTSQTIRDMLFAIEESAEEYEVSAESEVEAQSETSEEVLTGGGEGD